MCLAVPGKIIEIKHGEPPFVDGVVEFAGVRRNVNLVCVPDAGEGEYVLVHAGVAIAAINEAEALKLIEALHELDFDEAGDLQPQD